jgi:uncharacterized protein (TIGR03437 family)
VGAGAATPAIQQSFVNAYNRGLFSLKVTAPTTNVIPLGTPGLVQEFSAVGSTTLKCALVKPDPTVPAGLNDTLQMLSDLYTYYTSVGESTAGYPTIDTTVCPTNNYGTCDYQLFTKDYALFVYSAPTTANFSIADPFYTIWNTAGGISGSYGVVTTANTSVTSPISKVAGTQQSYLTGTIFSYPASSTTPTVYGIVEPAFDAFNSYGYTLLGFPTSNAFQVNSTGLMRQTFENGRIEWMPGNPASVLFPVAEVDITYANQGLTLASPGAIATLSANTIDTNGVSVTGRTLSWSTTNGSVVSVVGNGYSATVTAVGSGTAQIYVTAEGKTSQPLTVTVGGVCCSIGQGAPTQAIAQAFQAAVARNQLAVALPVSSPVTRQGTGYIQTLTAANGSGTTWVVAGADGASSAYILTGAIYAAYVANGGFTGTLGYPVSDPLPGPVQQFASGAVLAGSPVLIIVPQVATKWFALGGITAGAGAPAMAASSFTSYSGVTGVSQGFSNGQIFAIASGSLSGQAFFSSGLILARYLALTGPGSALGAPTSDVVTGSNGVSLENFEGGYIDLQPGAAAAVEHYSPRTPALTATPSVVVPGGHVHVSALGFTPGVTLSFTITGQPAFSVKSASGAFSWDIVVPPSAASGTVAIQATASGASSTLSASYTVTPVAALLPTLTLVSGDRQTGAPGALLPSPIVAVLQDSSGNPLAGVSIVTSASPGATAMAPSVTDAAGRAVVMFRLPPAAGVAVGSVTAGGKTAEFSALAASTSIHNFPTLTLSGQQSALVTSLAALLQYEQTAGTLPSPNGQATAASLTQYLTAGNGFAFSDTGDLIANPWVAAQFAGASLTLEPATLSHISDLLSQGIPVVLNLNLTINGGSGGTTSVDATGINNDGSIAIADPNPALGRTSLADYLNGFTAQGNTVTGALASVFSVASAQTAPSAAPFTVASPIAAGASTAAISGICPGVDYIGPSGGGVRFQYCDGSQALYETDFTGASGATLTDLTGGSPATIPAGAGVSWGISRSSGQLTVKALTPSISAVADSAGFNTAVSPGGLFSIFGSGFSGKPTVTVQGRTAQVLAAFPFQINAAMPAATAPGAAVLQVSSSAGSANSTLTVSPVSPGIFLVGVQGAILNADGSLNGPSSPAARGQFVSIYCSGLGATALKAGLQQVTAATSVVINGMAVTPSFAGLVAGFVGLYQVNVTIPAGVTPSLAGTVVVQQGTQVSNTAPIAVD